MAKAVSQAFTFTSQIESQIAHIATINASSQIERDDNIIGLFSMLGYDGSKRNVIGKEWERIQTVYATAAALVTFCTVEHEKKAFRRIALSLGYGKLQTAKAATLQAERAANKPVAQKQDESPALGKATQTILAAILKIDAGDIAGARALLVTMVPAKALTLAA